MGQDIFDNPVAKSASDLWKSGVPLDHAPDVFGKVRGLSKLRRDALSTARANAEMGKTNFRKAGKDADEFLDALSSFQSSIVGDAKVRSAKETKVIERLRSGELAAWGFPVHDREVTQPEQVPVFLLDHNFAKWRSRSFVGHDRKFVDVTVSEATASSEAARPIAKTAAPKKRGPKPIGPMIDTAIAYLRSNDPHFENRSQEKRINEIRIEVARQNPGRFPGNSQPGHTTVWNYLTGRSPII